MKEYKEERNKEQGVVAAIIFAVIAIAGISKLGQSQPILSSDDVEISNLIIGPTDVYVGQEVSISVDVKNIIEAAGRYTVTIGGDLVAVQTVSLQPGETKTVDFTYTPTEAKQFAVTADGLDGSFTAHDIPVADIRVTHLEVLPESCYIGDPVTITVTVHNFGAAAGSYDIVVNVT